MIIHDKTPITYILCTHPPYSPTGKKDKEKRSLINKTIACPFKSPPPPTPAGATISHPIQKPYVKKKCSFQIRRRERLHNTSPLTEPGAKNTICILKHAILQADYNKLTTFKSSFDKTTNILCMAEVEGSVYFVEDVHWCRFELEEGENEGEGY